MTDDSSGLVLEPLRAMRAEMGSRRGEIDAFRGETRGEFAATRERMAAIETELRGVTRLLAAEVGSRVGEAQDHESRIVRREALRP